MTDDIKTEKRQPGSLHSAGSAFVTRFKCVVCGKISTGRMPRKHSRHEGDTSARWPRWHAVKGQVCDGNFKEAEWVNVPAKPTKLTHGATP